LSEAPQLPTGRRRLTPTHQTQVQTSSQTLTKRLPQRVLFEAGANFLDPGEYWVVIGTEEDIEGVVNRNMFPSPPSCDERLPYLYFEEYRIGFVPASSVQDPESALEGLHCVHMTLRFWAFFYDGEEKTDDVVTTYTLFLEDTPIVKSKVLYSEQCTEGTNARSHTQSPACLNSGLYPSRSSSQGSSATSRISTATNSYGTAHLSSVPDPDDGFFDVELLIKGDRINVPFPPDLVDLVRALLQSQSHRRRSRGLSGADSNKF
jgi:hypothetical protein